MPLPSPPVPSYELQLPSTGKTIKYRPFLVKEEKILLVAMESQDEKQIKNAVVDLLKNCIQTRGIKIEELPSFDIEYIFLNIRGKSAGEEIQLKITCRDDDETQVNYVINVEDIQVIKQEGHTNKIMLNDDSGVVMKYPGVNSFIDTQIMMKTLSAEEVFDIVVNSVDQVFTGDEVFEAKTTNKKDIEAYLEGLTSKQFAKIQEFFATMPKLSHSFKITNPNTEVESEYTIEGLVNFFA
jgi:D-ribose pyranose/furanose isomerase RbsD